jgi:hypothetical protein
MEELAAYPGIDRVDEYMAERVRLGKHLRVVRSKAKDLFPIWPTSHSEMREVRYTTRHCVGHDFHHLWQLGRSAFVG